MLFRDDPQCTLHPQNQYLITLFLAAKVIDNILAQRDDSSMAPRLAAIERPAESHGSCKGSSGTPPRSSSSLRQSNDERRHASPSWLHEYSPGSFTKPWRRGPDIYQNVISGPAFLMNPEGLVGLRATVMDGWVISHRFAGLDGNNVIEGGGSDLKGPTSNWLTNLTINEGSLFYRVFHKNC